MRVCSRTVPTLCKHQQCSYTEATFCSSRALLHLVVLFAMNAEHARPTAVASAAGILHPVL
jgi:hypothetical protein